MVKGKEKKNKNKSNHIFGPIKYTHAQLEKEGVIVESNIPENRKSNIYFNISSPIPGSFIIELYYKGKKKKKKKNILLNKILYILYINNNIIIIYFKNIYKIINLKLIYD